MMVGAWNVQRAGNIDAEDTNTAARAALVYSSISLWLNTVLGLDVLILTEVTETGGRVLAAHLKKDQYFEKYDAEFYGNKAIRKINNNSNNNNDDNNDKVSPCSYLLVSKASLSVEAEVRGASSRRPYLLLTVDGWSIAGVHIVANQRKSLDSVIDMVGDLNNDKRSSKICLIGDLNYPYDSKLNDNELLKGMEVFCVDPGIPKTHRKGSILDFAVVTKGANIVADNLYNNSYKDWDDIDHAPIFYKLGN